MTIKQNKKHLNQDLQENKIYRTKESLFNKTIQIVSAIDEIAIQENLLAMNIAIEDTKIKQGLEENRIIKTIFTVD